MAMREQDSRFGEMKDDIFLRRCLLLFLAFAF